MSKVSIIVPVYNVEAFLKECVDSILSQSYADFELILVDDGSTDGSGAICDAYACDERVQVVHKANGGLSSARNAGMDRAVGDLFMFVDSDDYILPNALEILFSAQKETNADVVVADYFGEKVKPQSSYKVKPRLFTPKQALKRILQEKMNTSACAKLYKAALFQDIRFPEGLIYEDYATIPKVIGAAKSIAYTHACVYYYRPNPKSITGVTFSAKRMEYFTVAEMVKNYLQKEHETLIPWANLRDTRYAISFYMQVAKSGFTDESIEEFLIDYVRKNIFQYCFKTRYSILSKAYGILIALSPQLARKQMHK